MIFTKGAYQSAKFQENFNCLGQFHQICTLVGTFLLKVHTISAKKSTEELCIMILKINAKFKQKPICCCKIETNLVNFDPNTQKSPKFAL